MAGYTITETKSNNGYAVFSHSYSGDDGGTLVAVAKTKQELAEFFGDVYPQRVWPAPETVSQELAACFSEAIHMRSKISMIKLVRNATLCGLKEAKDAVEAAIEKRTIALRKGY
jgi:ribosomal protein L7/L12